MKLNSKQPGFSLLELILVIVLLGVLASGAGLLITKPIEAYNDQLRRQQLVDQGEMALRQIARDLRRALPNSIRVDGAGLALEMVNSVGGARYRDEIGGNSFVGINDWLDFSIADQNFNLLGQPVGTLTGNERLVIYNTAPSNFYSDVTANNDFGIVTPELTTFTVTVSSASDPAEDDEPRISLSLPFQFSQQSPGQRIFFINGPISYICSTGNRTLTRYDRYPYQNDTSQPTTDATFQTVSFASVQSGLVVSQLSACNFSYDPGSSQRGGIVTIQIEIENSGEKITLFHQVHVLNVP